MFEKTARKRDVGITSLLVIISHGIANYKSYDYLSKDLQGIKLDIALERENRELYYVKKSDFTPVKETLSSLEKDIKSIKKKMAYMNELLESENDLYLDELLTEAQKELRSRI